MSVAALVIMWLIYGAFYAYTFFLLNFRKKKDMGDDTIGSSNNDVKNNNNSNNNSKNYAIKSKSESISDIQRQQSPNKMQKKSTTTTTTTRRNPDAPDILTIPPGMRVIIEGIYQDTIISRNFVLILQLHNHFLSLIIALTQDSGVVQAMFYILLNSAMLVYLPIARPFKSRVLYIIFGCNCGGQLILGVFAALLGSNDRYPTMTSTTLCAIGIMMIMVEVILLFGSFIITITIIVQMLRGLLQKKKVSDIKVEKQNKSGGDTSRSKLVEDEGIKLKRKKESAF